MTTASLMVRRGDTGISTVLIHDTGWVKVPVQFLALAVVAKAENQKNKIPRLRVKNQSFASDGTSDFIGSCRTPEPGYYNLDTSKMEWKDK